MRRLRMGLRSAAQFRNSRTRAKLGFGATLTVAIGLAGLAFSGGASAWGTGLPDGRAYEMVSPVEKAGNDIEPRGFINGAGLAGDDEAGVLYSTLNGLPGSEAGALLIANAGRRGSTGWSASVVSPPELNQTTLASGEPVMVSNDLQKALVASKVALAPGAPAQQPNLYIHTIGSGYQLVTGFPIPAATLALGEVNYGPFNAVGASDDFSHVFFQAEYPLTADSPQEPTSAHKLYEWSGGTLRNVGILPGETSPTTVNVTGYPPTLRPVSEDGSQVLFGAEPSGMPLQLFLRENDAQTVRVSAPEAGVVDPNGPQLAVLVGAAADGSSVFFTSAGTLTADAFTGGTPAESKDLAPNLYRYDVATGKLTDLTVTARTEALGAAVKTAVVAPSGDAAFFVAQGELATGGKPGKYNLYRWGQGEGITFVADLEPGDAFVTNSGQPEAATDESGNAIAFVSTAGLGGEGAAEGVPEIYRYAVGEGLTCVSCVAGAIQSGARITYPALQVGSGGAHPISADGTKVFFTTKDALVRQDSNAKEDVYEWEGGADHLLSSGTGNSGSFLLDASPSGKDAFFVTRDQLVAADRDENSDVYDAREGGGFPEAEPEAGPCEAEACRPPSSAAPAAPQLGSRSFRGPHNKKPRHHRKKHHKRHKGRTGQAGKKSHKAHSGGKRG